MKTTMDHIAVSFDFDGVLAKSPFARGALYPALEMLAERYSSVSSLSNSESFEKLKGLAIEESRSRKKQGLHVEAYDWDGILVKVAKQMNLAWDQSLERRINSFFRDLREHKNSELLYPNAREVLKTLKHRRVHLLLITNGFRIYQYPPLKALGLADYFDGIFTSDIMGSVKPHKTAFSEALEEVKKSENRYIYHVGDRLIDDVSGAKNAGVTSIWIHRHLPQALKSLTPYARTQSDILEQVLLKQLDYEGYEGNFENQFVPDLIIAELDEIPDLILR